MNLITSTVSPDGEADPLEGGPSVAPYRTILNTTHQVTLKDPIHSFYCLGHTEQFATVQETSRVAKKDAEKYVHILK
jgi:hypothetical protein